MYLPSYSGSHALVIGINRYKYVSPLTFAVSDAEGVVEALKALNFPQQSIVLLKDEEATAARIRFEFLQFARAASNPDDRIVMFFAGHGHTISSNRGEVGFLIPYDADVSDLSTLIRWDEFTRGTDLISAKHILFLMDACYGGLAVTRATPPGSVRFISDMLRRSARQVLTAGKANEPVADSGGPLPRHSIFTGHLLEALGGKARDSSGNLTAHGVIAYVYNAVSCDPDSLQTPHYGYVQGDGDMIFEPFNPETESEDGGHPHDERIMIVPVTTGSEVAETSDEATLKTLLSEGRFRIQIFDYMAQKTRELLAATSEDFFPVQGRVEQKAFLERLGKYDESVLSMLRKEMLIGRWADVSQTDAVTLPMRRMAERLGVVGGSTWLIDSRWYPLLLLLYSCGLGSVAGTNYANLLSAIHSPVPSQSQHTPALLGVAVFEGVGTISEAFKWMAGRERQYVPQSEHMFSLLQPIADDVLFVGRQFEDFFDEVELLCSLEYGHLVFTESSHRYWSPVGRFGWRGRHYGISPLQRMREIADRMGSSWPPLKAGFFGGDKARFDLLAGELQKNLSNLHWL